MIHPSISALLSVFLHVQQNSSSESGFVEYMENQIKMELIFPDNKQGSRVLTPSEVCGLVV